MGPLDEVTRRRIAAILLVAAIAVVVLAARDVGPFSDPPTEEERAQEAIEGFFEAAHRKDWGAMCALVTPPIRDQIVQRTVTILAGRGGDVERCADALAIQDRLITAQIGETLSATKIAKVDDSRVSGNQAAVDVELGFPGSKRPEPRTFQLQLVGNEWRISGPVL